MLRDKDGNRLFRKMTVKVIFPDAIFPERTYTQHAGPKQGFGPDGVDQMLMNIADQLDTLYPWWEFRPIELVPVGRTARYIFNFSGYRAVPAPATPTTESSTPGPELTEVIHSEAIAKENSETTLYQPLAQELVPGDAK